MERIHKAENPGAKRRRGRENNRNVDAGSSPRSCNSSVDDTEDEDDFSPEPKPVRVDPDGQESLEISSYSDLIEAPSMPLGLFQEPLG